MQSTEILSPPRQTLQDLFARVEEIACVVIPASIAALNQFQQEPLLWQLIGAVHQNGGKVVIGPPDGASNSCSGGKRIRPAPVEQARVFSSRVETKRVTTRNPVEPALLNRGERRETQRFSPEFLCDLCVLCGEIPFLQ